MSDDYLLVQMSVSRIDGQGVPTARLLDFSLEAEPHRAFGVFLETLAALTRSEARVSLEVES